MSRMQINEYKKARRNQSRVKVRESLFISEYLETKYNHIYMEAATMYNNLNKKYPQKPDLRRSVEFRVWKNTTSFQTSGHIPQQKYDRTEYKDISLTPLKETHQSLQQLSMVLEIPLLSSPSSTRQPPAKEDQTVTTMHDNPPPVNEISPEITDEILQEGDQSPVQQDVSNIEPSLFGELSPQVIDKIIQGLRDDPEMNDLMRNVEEQIEEDLVGLEVDVPEIPDLLEAELNQLW